jgi:hypothetical protein
MAKKSKKPEAPRQFLVSQSKVKQWRKCHYAYHLKFVEGLRKKVKSRPLQFGSIVHEMLEAEAEGDDPFQVLKRIGKESAKLFRAEREMYGDLIDDIRQIMTEYLAYYPEKDLRLERRNGRSGEHKFAIELYEYQLHDVLWTGKIDGIGKTPNKLRWIVEHKTFSRKPSDDDRWRNLQSCSYIRAEEIQGHPPIDGMVWDYIRSKPPTRPMTLASNGQLSQKNIDTLPITLRETIAEMGMKERDYQGFITRAEENLAIWFQRIHTPVKESVVDHVFNDFIFSIHEMVRDHEAGNKCRDKNIERHCSWCDFEKICRAELQGDDVDFVIQKDYEYGDKDEHEIGNLAESTE